MLADKRINKPQHVKQLMNEQINRLRRRQAEAGDMLTIKEEIDIGRAIAYMSTVSLTAIKDGELEQRLTEIEKLLK